MKNSLKAGIGLSVIALSLPLAISAQQTVDRSRPPALGPPPQVKLPPIISRTLPNGLELLIVEHHELPVAAFNLVVGSGSTFDPIGRPGIAGLTAEMLREGTTSRSSLAISDQIAFLGIRLGTSSSWDASSVTLSTPTAKLDSALALFADVALNPSFPSEEFERIRRTRLTSLLQMRDRAPEIANAAYAALIFGAEHPYGQQPVGTEASVSAMTTSDLRGFYSTHFRPNNATLIIVGDVNPADIERRVGRLFGAWAPAPVPTIALNDPPAIRATTIYLIDKPGAAQSSFRLGGPGVPRSTRDYFALQVLNTILGGSFTSRLNQNLRETRGYTYGASSGFDYRKFTGPFTSRAEIVAGKTDSALVEFMKELRAIHDTVPQTELVKAKRYLQLRLPAAFETPEGIAGQLVPLVVYNLPLDFFEGFVAQIETITQADVQRVADQYITPDRMTIVIVGDRKSIEAPLRALNAGEIVLRDISGQPVQ